MNRLVLDLPHRIFQVWRYSVSHGLLLLRSDMQGEFQTRIDIIFSDVQWIKIPTSLQGIKMTQASRGKLRRVARECGLEVKKWHNGYLLSGPDYEGHIIASSFDMDEGWHEEGELDKWEMTGRENLE